MSLMIKKLASASQPPPLSVYSVLLKRVRQTIAAGKERALDAVEREAVRTKWETGKLIHQHILLNKDRASYGQQVLLKLSKDLGMSETELHYMVEFARSYKIFPHAGKLTWDRFRELLSVNDDKTRLELTDQAVRSNWTRETLRREVKKFKAPKAAAKSERRTTVDEVKPGKPGVYQIYRLASGELAVDLGFSNHYRPDGAFSFKEGEIVALAGKALKRSGETVESLFTYTAKVLEVIDGDTFKAQIDLGFGFSTNQKLRLRGLDAPEIISREGLKAKKFVETFFRAGRGKVDGGRKNIPSTVIIRTHKSDKYDRYLVDVWVEGSHLNQELLRKGLASRVLE